MIDIPTEELSLTPKDGGYLLRRVDHKGRASEMMLTEANVLVLPRVAHKPIGQILTRMTTPTMKERGIEPTTAVPAQPRSVSENLHQDSVTFEMHDSYGAEFAFAVEPEAARWLGQRLITRADKLDALRNPKTKQ